MNGKHFAALSAGGTKFIMAVLDEDAKELERLQIPTRTPSQTIPEVVAFFDRFQVCSIGICSFGPVDTDPDSPLYGDILNTPKQAWSQYPLGRTLGEALHVPFAMANDVTGALVGEMEYGSGHGLRCCAYVTVGTGIGGAVVRDGQMTGFLRRPSMGHIPVRKHPDDPAPDGFCPFHKGCIEGLASGPAIEKRWGSPAETLPEEHPAWEMEAYYLAQLCTVIILLYAPEQIILGGGVMRNELLFPMIRAGVRALLNDYIQLSQVTIGLDQYIVPTRLEGKNDILGACHLAKSLIARGRTG